jgi:hypothetical protein
VTSTIREETKLRQPLDALPHTIEFKSAFDIVDVRQEVTKRKETAQHEQVKEVCTAGHFNVQERTAPEASVLQFRCDLLNEF